MRARVGVQDRVGWRARCAKKVRAHSRLGGFGYTILSLEVLDVQTVPVLSNGDARPLIVNPMA
jgi:hypothetical protein